MTGDFPCLTCKCRRLGLSKICVCVGVSGFEGWISLNAQPQSESPLATSEVDTHERLRLKLDANCHEPLEPKNVLNNSLACFKVNAADVPCNSIEILQGRVKTACATIRFKVWKGSTKSRQNQSQESCIFQVIFFSINCNVTPHLRSF